MITSLDKVTSSNWISVKERREGFDAYLGKITYNSDSGCWIPENKLPSTSGYISIKFAGFCKLHRLMYYYYNGMTHFTPNEWQNLNKGKVVMHSCDTPACVNPAHLSLGTQLDNIRDRVMKGRSAYYESNGNHKLKETDVAFIRHYYGSRTIGQLSEFFNVDRSTIQRIASKKSWMPLPEPPIV